MRLFPNLVKAVAQSVEKIFEQERHAADVVENILKSDTRWGSRDRKFVASYIYDIVRWYRYYLACINPEAKNKSVVYYALFAVAHISKGYELPLWEEFGQINSHFIQEQLKSTVHSRAIKSSIPEWLDQMGVEELGEFVWEKEINALNNEAEVFIRLNSLKTNQQELISKLNKDGIEVQTVIDSFYNDHELNPPLKLVKRQALSPLKSYQNGLFEIQDAASQLVAPYLQVQPGMYVIDACAGAGGKSLHIASLMRNKGYILALDKEAPKLQELRRRAQKAGIGIIETRLVHEDLLKKLHHKADRLLLDVPCSGLGVLKRNPDTKWKLHRAAVTELQKTQQFILQYYTDMLKPGGLLVYATCSILPSENQKQVNFFLRENADHYRLIQQQNVMPSQGYDGFYMACIQKLQ